MNLYFVEYTLKPGERWQFRWFRTEEEAFALLDRLVLTPGIDRSVMCFTVEPVNLQIPSNSWKLVELLNHLDARPPPT